MTSVKLTLDLNQIDLDSHLFEFEFRPGLNDFWHPLDYGKRIQIHTNSFSIGLQSHICQGCPQPSCFKVVLDRVLRVHRRSSSSEWESELQKGEGGFPGYCPPPPPILSHVSWGHWMADGCIPSLLFGLDALRSLFLPGPAAKYISPVCKCSTSPATRPPSRWLRFPSFTQGFTFLWVVEVHGESALGLAGRKGVGG